MKETRVVKARSFGSFQDVKYMLCTFYVKVCERNLVVEKQSVNNSIGGKPVERITPNITFEARAGKNLGF